MSLKPADELLRENGDLRQRLSRLSKASLRINESLDFDDVLQGVLDSARSLTAARYGVLTLHDEGGHVQDFLSSGMTSEESGQLWDMPEPWRLYDYLGSISQPLRLSDLLGHIRSESLPEFPPPVAAGPGIAFLASPVLHRDERVGNLFMAEKEHGREFTQEDEDTLVMFAVPGGDGHRQRPQAPGGATVQGRPGDPHRHLPRRRGGLRRGDGNAQVLQPGGRCGSWTVLRNPGQSPVDLLDVVTFRRADGREISLREFPMAELLSVNETVRARGGDHRCGSRMDAASRVLLNATPILSDEGAVESMVVTMQDMADVEEQERLRVDFLAMVSHELRTPLTSIMGSASAIMQLGGGPGPRRGAPVRPHHRGPGRAHERAGRRPAGRCPHRDGHAGGGSRTGRGWPCLWTGRGAASPAREARTTSP